MTAIVSAYAEAVKLPKAPPRGRVRLCQYDRAFCVECPDNERCPCVIEGVYRDCGDCKASGCPCMTCPTTKRSVAYHAWKGWRNERNAREVERKARKGRHWADYSLGRTCSICGAPIVNKGKSGLCLPCTRERPRT